MNLYIESAKILNDVKQKKSTVKTSVYSSSYENKNQMLALVCRTLKYGSYLSQIAQSQNLLATEHLLRKDESLCQALLYDFLIGKKLYRPGRLKQTMTRHKHDLKEEYRKICSEKGVECLSELQEEEEASLPRYVRVNLIKTTVEDIISKLEPEWECVVSPASRMKRFKKVVQALEKHQFTRDLHLPDVLVFPPGTNFSKHELLLNGEIVLQDKASCFPAHVLDPPKGATVVDCCAAPGNKTSHLASLMRDSGQIFAFDKHSSRMAILRDRMKESGITCVTTSCQDFIEVNKSDDIYKDVEYVIVDPSCSGSGIVSRLNEYTDDDKSTANTRLNHLSGFQRTILEHALMFPKVKKVVYSTCSIHEQENECVVESVYKTFKGKFEFCNIMPDWPERGVEGYDHAQCFLRMTPENSMTNGFFVACFVRNENYIDEDETDEVNNNENFTGGDDEIVEDDNHHLNNCKKRKKHEEQDSLTVENEDVEDEYHHLNNCKKKKKHKDHKESTCENVDINDEESHSDSLRKKKRKHKDKKNLTSENDGVNEEEISKKEKKHKCQKNLTIENDDIDSTPDKCDMNVEDENHNSTHSKKKKKHKKSKKSSKSSSNNSDNDEHSNLIDLENAVDENDIGEHENDSRKKHKRKHKHKDNEETNDYQSPPKKKKRKKHKLDQ